MDQGHYDNGQLKYEIHRNALGQRHGATRWYHKNGEAISETYYCQGQRDGMDRAWDCDGEPMYEDYYLCGNEVNQDEYWAAR